MFKMACFTKSKTESGKNQENVETNGNILSLLKKSTSMLDIQSLKILTLNLIQLIIPQLHFTKISQGSAFSNLGRLPMICGSATVPGC